jgi:RNA polymerase sigma-70 factor (ECF subfamily)
MFDFSRRIAARPGDLSLGAQDAPAPAAMSAREVLERHFEEHYEALCRFLRYSGADEAMAEDFAQEAFLRLHRHLAEGRPEQNIRAWLFRVAYRLWIDRLREGKREAPAADDAWELWSRVLRDPAPGAERELLARERREWLRAAVLGLSQVERQALHLRADGLQYREIAEVLGLGYWPVVEAVRRALDILGEEAHGL